MVSCCKVLVRSFVLAVRSQSGNNVPVNLYQGNNSPLEVQAPSWGRRSQWRGGSLRARAPDPTPISWLGSQAKRPGPATGPQVAQTGEDCVPCRLTGAVMLQRQGQGRGSLLGQGHWAAAGLWSPADTLPACSLGTQLTDCPEAG